IESDKDRETVRAGEEEGFARAQAEKDEDYWDSILWSDETKINALELKLYGVAK
ncbi:hypothetical protein L3Q82_024457, partial [Scortum barcoo]